MRLACVFGRNASVMELSDDCERQNLDDLTLVQRVEDVIAGFNSWSDLAIKRLHEIHRLQGEECEFCSKWIDGRA